MRGQFLGVTYSDDSAPAPLYKPGTKLRHKGDHEQKAEVKMVYPDPRDVWTYVLLIKYRNAPVYMSDEGMDHWEHSRMWVWEEDFEPSSPALEVSDAA